MVKVIEAKMQGTCGICRKTYTEGTRIAKDSKTGKWVEANCLWPDKVNANSVRESSKSKVAASGAGVQPTINSTTPNAPAPMPLTSRQIEDITAEAVQSIRKREELESLDISELVPLIAEQMAIRRVQKEQEFSLAMSRHIQQIKLDNIRKVKGE